MTQGSGLAPAICAKAASLRIRPGCDHTVRTTAAVTAPAPGRSSSSGAVGVTSNVICLRLAASSPSRSMMGFASRTASARAVAEPRDASRRRQAAIVEICTSVSARRASMPRSWLRTGAVRALMHRSRSTLRWSRAAVRTCSALCASPARRSRSFANSMKRVDRAAHTASSRRSSHGRVHVAAWAPRPRGSRPPPPPRRARHRRSRSVRPRQAHRQGRLRFVDRSSPEHVLARIHR